MNFQLNFFPISRRRWKELNIIQVSHQSSNFHYCLGIGQKRELSYQEETLTDAPRPTHPEIFDLSI